MPLTKFVESLDVRDASNERSMNLDGIMNAINSLSSINPLIWNIKILLSQAYIVHNGCVEEEDVVK